jgi:hypothetical protein
VFLLAGSGLRFDVRRGIGAASVLAIPLVAILSGVLVGIRSGVSAAAFAPNLIGALLGGVMFLGVRRRGAALTRFAPMVAGLALVLLTLTFSSPGIDGVCRWLMVGPLAVNVSAVVGPWLLWAIHVLRWNAAASVAATATVSICHAFQPDAGQATAFGCATVVLFALSTSAGRLSSALGCATALCGIVVAWRRADPLVPVDHVERILHLAVDAGPPLAIGAFISLVMLLMPMLLIALKTPRTPVSILAACLATYTVAGIAATELGHFPVPVIGAGAAPVLGWFGAMAALAASSEAQSTQPRRVDASSVH